MVSSDPLRREIVLKHMAEALPSHEDDSNSESHLSSSHEVIALLCHACMVATGYSLHPPQSSPRLPGNWNSSYGQYSFTYHRAVSSTQCQLRVSREGNKDQIRATTSMSKQCLEMETEKVGLYTTSSSLPLRLFAESNDGRDLKSVCSKIADIFQDGALEREMTPRNYFSPVLNQKQV